MATKYSRRTIVALLISFFLSTHLRAEEYRLAELFAGYSLLHGDLQHRAGGWEVSVAKTFNRWLSSQADFDAHHQSSATIARHQHSLLLGPQFSHRTANYTLFVHALAGACRIVRDPGSQTGFASLGGGGIDWDRGFVSVRVAQIDYHNAYLFGTFQHEARFSFGVVFHLIEFRDYVPKLPPPPEKKDLRVNHLVHSMSASGVSHP